MNRDRLPELALLAQRLEAERDAARRIIRDLAPEEWITAGMAHELAQAANDRLDRSPETSAALAGLAVQVATRLGEQYPRRRQNACAAAAGTA